MKDYSCKSPAPILRWFDEREWIEERYPIGSTRTLNFYPDYVYEGDVSDSYINRGEVTGVVIKHEPYTDEDYDDLWVYVRLIVQ